MKTSSPVSGLIGCLNLLLLAMALGGCSTIKQEDQSGALSESPAGERTLLFDYSGEESWEGKWFLDGTEAVIVNDEPGMLFEAGKEWGNDASHAVFWTLDSFAGDILIEYDFIRTDASGGGVIILYFHATGTGNEEYPEDIFEWRDKRTVPVMSTYFLNMNTYHLSYSTNRDVNDDYVRLRRYEDKYRLAGTEILPDYFSTGLFKQGVTYHISISRIQEQIEMRVTNTENPAEMKTFKWNTGSKPLCHYGRIGLRHMYTRAARYQNFKVWQINESKN